MKLKGGMNHPKVFELRPDKLLIDPSFQGYKLSLETLPSYVIPLPSDLDHASVTEEQYTLQHVKLTALTNHVLPDPWSPGHVYIVDSSWNVYKLVATGERKLEKTWNIPNSPKKIPGRFNVTLTFIDATHAVLADGCGTIFILETGVRNAETLEWKVLFQQELFSSKKNSQFLILESICYKESLIDTLLLRIDERSEWKDFLEFHQDTYLSSSQHPFVSVLEWLTFKKDEKSVWKVESSRSLVGRSGIDYAAIEENGTAIYVASDDPFYFSYDSEQAVQFAKAPIETPKSETAEKEDVKETKSPDYVWHQTNSDISLWFRLPEESKKADLTVDMSVNDIHIEYKKQTMLSGKFFLPIKLDGSTWTLESGKLEITLTKSQEGEWTDFIPDKPCGEEIKDPELVQQIHSQLIHLCSDKWGVDPHKSDVFDPQGREECDEYPAATAALMRIDRKQQKVTNQASLDSHQWIFNVQTGPGSVRSICIRHDVDAIVWQPQIPIEIKEEDGSAGLDWTCRHLATFSALGYLQAAKERKKYVLSASDFSYAVICDDVKHIYVYRQPEQLDNDLRNRKTGKQVSHVARQQVIALDPPLDVMGAHTGNDFLYVLTPKNLHLVRMRAPETEMVE